MEKKILAYLNRWPGARKREIASSLQIWLCDKLFLDTMSKLKNDRLIKSITINDSANMEFYDKWYLTEAGYRAIMNVD